MNSTLVTLITLIAIVRREYSWLNDEIDVGTAIVVSSKPKKWDRRGEYFSQMLLLRVDAPRFRPTSVIRAIYDSMQRRCHCAHDCCGHIFSSPSNVRKVGENLYAVRITGGRNV